MVTKAARSRPFLVIPGTVSNYDLLEDPGSLGLEVVECKRSAVGCGPTGVRVLEGISLYLVRGGDDDDPVRYPRMCIRVSDEAYDLVSAEIDDRTAHIWGRNLRMGCRVFSMQGDIMVISLVFIADHDPLPFRGYYLVYDSATATLFMIPYPPPHCQTVGMPRPLPVRRPDDGHYSLAFLAYRSNWQGDHEPDALCLWSQPPLTHNTKPPALPLPLNDVDPWVAKSRRPAIASSDRLDVHVVFSSKDYAFWVDLEQGILYCSISDMLNGEEPVDFRYIPLPKECSKPTDIMDATHMHRNMGLVGDSAIWFVALESSGIRAKHTKVVVWTLDLTELMSKKKNWRKLREFKMQRIWELDAFHKKGLPRTEPRFPIWRQQRGGILYMLLPNFNNRYGHLVGIHVGCSTSKMRLLSSRSLPVPWTSHPVVLPSDFFIPRDTVV